MHTAYTFVHAHASHSEALTLTSQVCLLAFVSLLVYVISWKCTSLTFACVRDFLEMHFAYFYFSWKCASLTFAFPQVEVFEHGLTATAGNDLQRVLWLKSRNSEVWLEKRVTYTRSLAVMCMV